jgi:uncharacterized membrane protein
MSDNPKPTMARGQDERTYFSATIRPHRSLTARNRRLVIGLSALVCAFGSVPFLLFGAWPVAGFLGLDFVLLAVAFRVNSRRAEAREEIHLTGIELLFRKIDHRRHELEWRLNPAWVRLVRQEDADFGLRRLSLVSGRTSLAIAEDLSPPERQTLAHALELGLNDARRGYRRQFASSGLQTR